MLKAALNQSSILLQVRHSFTKSIQVLLGYSTLFTAEDSLSLFFQIRTAPAGGQLPLGRGFPPKTVLCRPFVCISVGYWDHFSLPETPEEVLYITSGQTWPRREVSSPSVPSLLARFTGLQSHGAVKHHKKRNRATHPPTYKEHPHCVVRGVNVTTGQ